MEIKSYQNKDRGDWDEYVKRHPKGTFFHQIGWKEVIEKSFGHQSHYLIAKSTRDSDDAHSSDQKSNIIGTQNPQVETVKISRADGICITFLQGFSGDWLCTPFSVRAQ